MATIQEIFSRLNELKKEQKDIKSAYREALNNSEEYKDIVEKRKNLDKRRKEIEATVKQEFSSEFTKLDDLKIDIAGDIELLTDAAITKLMKGETVEITDENNITYQPVFSVKFKKS